VTATRAITVLEIHIFVGIVPGSLSSTPRQKSVVAAQDSTSTQKRLPAIPPPKTVLQIQHLTLQVNSVIAMRAFKRMTGDVFRLAMTADPTLPITPRQQSVTATPASFEVTPKHFPVLKSSTDAPRTLLSTQQPTNAIATRVFLGMRTLGPAFLRELTVQQTRTSTLRQGPAIATPTSSGKGNHECVFRSLTDAHRIQLTAHQQMSVYAMRVTTGTQNLRPAGLSALTVSVRRRHHRHQQLRRVHRP